MLSWTRLMVSQASVFPTQQPRRTVWHWDWEEKSSLRAKRERACLSSENWLTCTPSVAVASEKGVTYMMNSGPQSTEPCATPNKRWTTADVWAPTWTDWVLLLISMMRTSWQQCQKDRNGGTVSRAVFGDRLCRMQRTGREEQEHLHHFDLLWWEDHQIRRVRLSQLSGWLCRLIGVLEVGWT